VKDVDFAMKQVTVRSGKGDKDRFTTLSTSLIPLLENQLRRVKAFHEQDLAAGHGAVYLPYALERKYPGAARDWSWQYLFPAREVSTDPLSGVVRRHHVDPAVVNKAIKVAARRAGLTKVISAHTFRQNAECREMPSEVNQTVRTLRDSCGLASLTRHFQRPCKNARSLSPGR
jgi:integrase